MNRIHFGLTLLLLAAVIFLFVRDIDPQPETPAMVETTQEESPADSAAGKKPVPLPQAGHAPTGKIAFVNIDRLNDESLEIKDLVAESKRRQAGIESSVERLQQQYEQKVGEFQRSQQAGIAPESEMRAKAREIEDIEREAMNKQVQMEKLTMDISEKNSAFQQTVREFMVKWNNGRYDYVLSYSEAIPSMLLGNSALEVTDEVISKLNEEYKQRKTGKK